MKFSISNMITKGKIENDKEVSRGLWWRGFRTYYVWCTDTESFTKNLLLNSAHAEHHFFTEFVYIFYGGQFSKWLPEFPSLPIRICCLSFAPV